MAQFLRIVSVIFGVVSLSSCASLGNNNSSVQWLLVDDFEGAELEGWQNLDVQNETVPFVENPQVTEIRSELSGNGYLIRKPAEDGVVGNRKAISFKTLPKEVEVGEVYTFYTRVNVEVFPNNHSFGLSNVDAAMVGENNYNSFEPMVRITDKAESDGSLNDGTLMVLEGHKKYSKIFSGDGESFANPMDVGQWYEIWMVVNNALIADGGQTYDLYVRGGEFKRQTKVYSGAVFRMQREKSLKHFMAICNTGPIKSPYGNGGVLYDDIYMVEGEVLESPLD